MPEFTVDDDVAALVERLAKKRPFENLSFNEALRRIFLGETSGPSQSPRFMELDDLLAQSMSNHPKKSPSPSASQWVTSVTELKGKKNLTTWKAVCDLLKIETAGDSARRRLRNWVKANRPSWPEVPEV